MIVLDEIVSMDGYAARTDGSIDFFLERRDLIHAEGDPTRVDNMSAVLLGGRTYREFVEYWPTQDPAALINRLPKHVLSSTMTQAPWGTLTAATVEAGDAVAVAARLDRSYPGDVIVWGSLRLAQALLAAGAVGEVWTRIVPVAIGKGRRFTPAVDVQFISAHVIHDGPGWTAMRYVPRRMP